MSVRIALAGAPGIGPARARLAAGGSSSTLAGGGGECSGESCGVTGAGAAKRREKGLPGGSRSWKAQHSLRAAQQAPFAVGTAKTSESLSFPCEAMSEARAKSVEESRANATRSHSRTCSIETAPPRVAASCISRVVWSGPLFTESRALPESCWSAAVFLPTERPRPRRDGAESIHAMPRRTQRPHAGEARSHLTLLWRHARQVWRRSFGCVSGVGSLMICDFAPLFLCGTLRECGYNGDDKPEFRLPGDAQLFSTVQRPA